MKFKLAGVEWKVEEREMTEMGLCDFEAATIYLRRSLCDQVKEATLFHELVHAIMYTAGHSLPHDEREVDVMGNLLHQFFTTKEDTMGCGYKKGKKPPKR